MPGTFAYTRSTNILVVTGGTSGSPADFASMLTADRAGSVTLLAAWTPNSNTKALTYQITPAEVLALLISFVVASKTTEADYIFITGTDAWDNAQTESIDVSTGNGTYVSTKRFKTITNIDCSDNSAGGGTVWADGTVAVTQPQWGVVWNFSQPSLSDVWKVAAKIEFGDGSTATYFAMENGILITDCSFFTGDYDTIVKVKTSATLRLGMLFDADTKKTGGEVCWMNITVADFTPYAEILIEENSIILAYNTNFMSSNYYGSRADTNIAMYNSNSSCRIWNCTFLFHFQIGSYGSANYYNLRFLNNPYGVRGPTNEMTLEKIEVLANNYASYFTWGSEEIELKDIYIRNSTGFLTYHNQNTYSGLLNPDADTWDNSFVGDTTNFKLYRRYTINLKVIDKNGDPIENAVVRMEDKDGNYTNAAETRYGINDIETAADGAIAEQIVSRGYYADTAPDTLVDFSPHILTISKIGYQTLVIPEITVEKLSWTIELQPAGTANMSRVRVGH